MYNIEVFLTSTERDFTEIMNRGCGRLGSVWGRHWSPATGAKAVADNGKIVATFQ